jgi:hypothetical protein
MGKNKVQFQASGKLKNASPIELAGGVMHPQELVLEDLPGAGEYQATLLLSALGKQTVQREVQLFLREPWWVALFWIVLGIVASLLLRWATQHLRPRLESQQTVLLLRQELEQEAHAQHPPLDSREQQFLARLVGEMNRLIARIQFDALKAAQIQASLELMERKRALCLHWLSARRQVLVMPEELRGPFKKQLDSAEAALTQPGTTVEALSTLDKELQGIPGKIADAIRKKLEGALTSLEEQIKAHQVDPSSELGQRLAAQVSPDIAKAREHLADTNLTGVEQLDHAFAAYDMALRAYVGVIADELEAKLLDDTPPMGLAQAGWETLREQVRSAL